MGWTWFNRAELSVLSLALQARSFLSALWVPIMCMLILRLPRVLIPQALAQNTGPGAPVSRGAKCGCLLPLVTDHSCTDRPPSSLCMGCMPSWAIQPGLAIKLEPSASMILQEKIDSTGCVNAWWQACFCEKPVASRWPTKNMLEVLCSAFSLEVENKCSRRSEFLCKGHWVVQQCSA